MTNSMSEKEMFSLLGHKILSVNALTSTWQASFCQHGRSLPSPPEISAFYSRLNHAYMHPLTCAKYGAAALALGRPGAKRHGAARRRQ